VNASCRRHKSSYVADYVMPVKLTSFFVALPFSSDAMFADKLGLSLSRAVEPQARWFVAWLRNPSSPLCYVLSLLSSLKRRMPALIVSYDCSSMPSNKLFDLCADFSSRHRLLGGRDSSLCWFAVESGQQFLSCQHGPGLAGRVGVSHCMAAVSFRCQMHFALFRFT
jgi:hypothetical protein